MKKTWTKWMLIAWIAMDIALVALGISACRKTNKPANSSNTVIESVQPDDSATEDSSSDSSEGTTDYKITYYVVIDSWNGGLEEPVPLEEYSFLKLRNGKYPTTYKANTRVHVDELIDIYFTDSTTDVMFVSWYADPLCTREYGQEVDFQTSGNLEVYALLDEGKWTEEY